MPQSDLAFMTKYLFDTLVRLFAIAVNRNPDADNAKVRALFEKFLNDYLDPKYVASFLLLFDNYLKEYSSQISAKKLSLNSVKLIKYCEETAEALKSTEKAILVFNIIRLIYQSSQIDKSLEFINLIAELYGIKHSDINKLIEFFNDSVNHNTFQFEIFNNKNIDYFYFSNDVFVVRNNSDSDLLIDTVPFYAHSVCFAIKSSVISANNQQKIYFDDILTNTQTKSTQSFKIFTRNLTLIKGNQVILNNINLKFNAGEFIGIIGKSGAGKSSFLNVLARADTQTNGQILFEENKNRNLKFSYLTQNYSFIPFFTVREHLMQRLSFLQNSEIIKFEQIENAALSVGLTADLDKIVIKNGYDSGQLSGGQQKRVRIAMELLANPDVLLLDEPTSGLASIDSFKILSILKTLSLQGKLVIATVHQPDYDSFNLFDKIVILDEGGYVVYYGNPISAVEYLREKTDSVDKMSIFEDSKNPSLILELVQRGKDNNSKEFWKNQSDKNHKEEKILSSKGVPLKINQENKAILSKSILSQIFYEFKIDIRNVSRLLLVMLIPLISGILFAFVSKFSAGDIYNYQQNPNIPLWVLMILITALFTGLISSGNEFIGMRQYYVSEHYLINKRFSLGFAKIFKSICFSGFQALLLILPSIIILKMNNFFIQIFIITALLTIWGAAFGLLMSKISKSISVVYLSIPLVIVINMLFSGVLIKFDNFNPKFNRKSVPDLAMIVPTYHGINTLITEMYLYDDKKSNIVKQKEMLYEASYYLDYFTPELHNLMKKDSLRTMKIIESECKKNQFFPKIQNQSLDSYLIKIKSYYSNQYNHSLAWLSKKDINQGNTNQSIKFLVNSYYQDRLVIKSNEFLRRFLVPYIPAYYKQENSFFGAYYKVFGFAFDNYTFAIISISLSILFTSLLMLLIKKPLI